MKLPNEISDYKRVTEFPAATEPKKVLLMRKEFLAFHCH